MIVRNMQYCALLALVCLVEVMFCRTCTTEFDNTQSKAYRADIVIEGTVRRTTAPILGRYNATFKIGSRKKIYKGTVSGTGPRRSPTIIVAEFGPSDAGPCLAPVEIGQNYIVFLNSTSILSGSNTVYYISELPVKTSKKVIKDIRRIVCKNCAKLPKIKKLQDIEVNDGKKITIKCRAQGNPRPEVEWYKDDVLVQKRKGLRIIKKKSGTTLKISKAQTKDEGVYKCVARNVLGDDVKEINVSVRLPQTTTLPPSTTSNTTKGHWRECLKQTYCLNGGTCVYYPTLDGVREKSCSCRNGYDGKRCQSKTVIVPTTGQRLEELQNKDRTITILGICIGVVVLLCIVLVGWFLSWKKGKQRKMHEQERINFSNYVRCDDDVDHPRTGAAQVISMRPLVQRACSMTQTEPVQIGPVDLSDFIPQAEPFLRAHPKERRLLSTESGRRISRSRLSAVSHTPGASFDDIADNSVSGPRHDEEFDPDVPSQSSKTESYNGSPRSNENSPGSRHRVHGTSNEDNMSLYDNDEVGTSNDSLAGLDEIDSPKIVNNDTVEMLKITQDPKQSSGNENGDIVHIRENSIHKAHHEDKLAKAEQHAPLIIDS